MNSSPAPTPKKQGPDALIQRLLVVWLPILAVAILIFWLSGGIPPAVLRLLLQMLSHWHSLQVALGGELFLPFAIVLLQCLFLFAAWAILALLVWREIGVFGKLQVQQRILRAQQQAQQAHMSSNPTSTRATTGQQGVQMTPAELDSMLLEEEEVPNSKNTGIQVFSNEDAFDASAAIFELKAEPEESETNTTISATTRTPEEEMIFVYGNPFDGELPEVFHYDMDLRREVQDMQNDSRLQAQEREKQHISQTTED